MAKFAHLLILSVLIIWLAGSGCVGNNASDAEEAGIAPDTTAEGASGMSEIELTHAEILELNSDITALENLLEDASLEEELVEEDLVIAGNE
ncbi:MAG TPA: hypothetical protein HA306_05785 [Methanosarcina sp.]|nr:hypothetical protein [Methanosarcina sp.]